MNILKITNKSLITNQDLAFNYQMGIPIEVFCSKQGKTVAFGQIKEFNEQIINVYDHVFCRSSYLFFGQPANFHETN